MNQSKTVKNRIYLRYTCSITDDFRMSLCNWWEKQKQQTQISTWNIRTWAQKEKLDNDVREKEKMIINLIGVHEMRWKGSGKIISDKQTIIEAVINAIKEDHCMTMQ